MNRLVKVLFATIAGFAAGVLVAPKSGRETRADLKHKAEDAKDEVELKAKQAKAAATAAAGSVKTGAKSVEREARDMAKSAKKSGVTKKPATKK